LAGENKEENIILSIGRLTEMKGFEYLIRACMKIKAGMTFKCHIVGEGPLRKDLTELVKTSGLKESVVFDGVLDNIRIKQLLSKANLFVLPSIWSDKDGQDGIPVVLMEAMASGIPVIASKISGIPELIEDGKTGLLVEPKNEQQLTEKIINLLNDKGLQKRLVMNARLKIEQDFDIVKNTDLLLDIFKKNKRIPKVLFIIWSLEKGGAERFLTSLAKSMDRNKIEPTVCCLNWKGAWAKELEDKGIQVIGLNKRRKIDFQAFIDLVKIIKNGKFDIVNTYLWGADVMGRLAAIFAGVPVIVSTAENVDIWKKWWHRLIDKLLSYRTNKIIAVSGAVKEYYHKKIGIPLAKIIYIPNAIEINRFENIGDTKYLYDEFGLKPEDFILVCIGRLNAQKGHRYLFEALNLLNGRYRGKILVVGEGPLLENLKLQVANLNLKDKVIFTGKRKDIPQILHLADGLVLPSLYEGLPLCILEAMAAAKPVIATKAGGIEELVVNQETGFIVPAQNPEALASAIRNLMNLADKGKSMGKKGKEIVIKNFSVNYIAETTTDLFISSINTIR
jgi:glycosyltransferase involved in cell wall biosynthesis